MSIILKGEKMKRIIIFAMVFMLCACENRRNEKNLGIATEQYAGNYLFNTDKGECIEISGEDLLNRKKVNISTVEEDGRDVELVIKRDDYGPAIAMGVFFGENGIDLVTYLEKSTDELFGALKGFYYQLSCYDFDNDGEKEIIVAAGNKKDILELYILRLDYNNPDFDNAQIFKCIKSGSKAYVNEKKEICVMDSQGKMSIYSLDDWMKTPSTIKSLDEKPEEIVFSWYKKNHYEYEEKNKQKYSFQIVDKDVKIYGEKCYLVVMYFDGSQYLNFAVNVKDNELYLCYEDNFTFIPINNIMVLNNSKYLNKVKQATDFLKKKCNKNNIVYCDTVMRFQKVYFVFAEYSNMEFQTMYFLDVESKDVFTWDLKKDVLNAVAS